MDDLISRQAAIDVLSLGKEILSRVLDDTDVVGADREKYSWGLGLIESYINDIEELPSAQPPYDPNEWCHDCKEYDQERHCCPRFNRVIKQTKEDFEAQNEIIHCTDCRYHGTAICRIWSRYGTINTPGYGFCYRAERKEQDE